MGTSAPTSVTAPPKIVASSRRAKPPSLSTRALAAASGSLVFTLTSAFQFLRLPMAVLSALGKLLPSSSRGAAIESKGLSGLALGKLYDVLDFWWEVKFYTQLRPVICGDVEGEVLELGVGTGRNLAYYPSGARVTGIDLSEPIRTLAVGNAACLKNIPDNSADVVVSTFMFCVMPDELIPPTLSEVARVLRPGGTFRFADIQYSQASMLRRWIQAWYAVHFAFGAKFDGKIRQHLQAHKGLTLTHQIPLKGDTLWLLEGKVTKPAQVAN